MTNWRPKIDHRIAVVTLSRRVKALYAAMASQPDTVVDGVPIFQDARTRVWRVLTPNSLHEFERFNAALLAAQELAPLVRVPHWPDRWVSGQLSGINFPPFGYHRWPDVKNVSIAYHIAYDAVRLVEDLIRVKRLIRKHPMRQEPRKYQKGHINEYPLIWYREGGRLVDRERVLRDLAARRVQRRREERRQRRLQLLRHPNPNLGWRLWRWENGRLVSPVMHSPWPEDGIFTNPAIGSCGGIYALYLPTKWRRKNWRNIEEFKHIGGISPDIIDGVVECWGDVVRSEHGWRAQNARILAVRAPSTEIGLAIERAYPTVTVYYDD